VTGGAAFDIKGTFPVVAGTARLAVFHVLHGCPLVASGCKHGWMAGMAIRVDFQVFLVAEVRGSGGIDAVGDFLDLVTAGALLEGEAAFAVMTCAAGFPFFHFGHADFCSPALGSVQAGMAVAAMVGFDMFGMFENGGAGFLDLEDDLLCRVTGCALVDPKGFLAVMACAA